MALPDNRIRFPATKIDFTTEVGTTGQDHDNYPAPLAQARFDHLRMALIGLLSQQSSYEEPTQKRDGTPWFDLNANTLKIYIAGEWKNFADAIQLSVDAEGLPYTLTDWYSYATSVLRQFEPEVCFGGSVSADNVFTLNIPANLQQYVSRFGQVFLYVDGLFYDPRKITMVGTPYPTTINLASGLSKGQNYFVNIKRISSTTFYTADVTQP